MVKTQKAKTQYFLGKSTERHIATSKQVTAQKKRYQTEMKNIITKAKTIIRILRLRNNTFDAIGGLLGVSGFMLHKYHKYNNRIPIDTADRIVRNFRRLKQQQY